MDTYPLGKVSIAGYAAPLGPISSNLKSEWLIGGCTAWSRNFIDKNPHPLNFSLRWAVCEDLIFSFPFRDKYSLMVCSTAEAIHNEGYSEENFKTSVFFGKSLSTLHTKEKLFFEKGSIAKGPSFKKY